MAQLLDYFQGIYIINLPSRTDRLSEIQDQFKKIGLSLDHPNIHVFAAIRPDDAGEFENIGARGCFLSHLGVLKDARSRQLETILVFEDDLDFASDFLARVDSLIEQLKTADWGIYYGGHRLSKLLALTNQADLVEVDSDLTVVTAHFIGFRQPVIDGLINYLEQALTRPAGSPECGPMHVDGAYSWFRKEHPHVRVFLSVPELGYQRMSRTDIHELKWYDQVIGIRTITQIVRKLLRKLRS
ncbi:glycosyltransferase family 25 protein [Methylomonas sp. AM2-LC]|uniref:glycosyltransferase family 25 protein n=1 Tax=Methylomonas sp. AM2-LC TaxID=3153301 RepID=UPI0032672923